MQTSLKNNKAYYSYIYVFYFPNKVLAPDYLKVPDTEQEWESVARKFEARWNFPNGVGAIDGKRVIVQQPSNSGSHFYDYKGNNSIVLLAVFGPDYQCLWASAGTNG